MSYGWSIPHSTFYPRQDWSGRTAEVLYKRGKYEWVVYRENGRFDELIKRLTWTEFLKRFMYV